MEAIERLQNQKSNAECSPLLAGSDGEMMAMMRNLGLQKPTKREKKTELTGMRQPHPRIGKAETEG